ncbi:MAG: exosortase C-terminal domain/associated protein EpsI [Vicinamibacterales bacterium]
MTSTGRCVLVTVVLLSAWAVRLRLAAPQPSTAAAPLSTFPVVMDRWQGQESPLQPDVVRTAAVDDYMNRSYRSGNGVLGLYVGYYKNQREGEALHSPLNCLPGAGWAPMKTETVQLASDPGSRPHTVNKLLVEKGIDRMLVLYWYQTVSRVTASEYWRKIFLVKDAFESGRTDVALVRIISPVDPRDPDGETGALTLSRSFAERVLPELQKQLFQ